MTLTNHNSLNSKETRAARIVGFLHTDFAKEIVRDRRKRSGVQKEENKIGILG
jgi:hypothetical protein